MIPMKTTRAIVTRGEISGLVTRGENALAKFVACMVERGLSHDEAMTLRDFYIGRKVIKVCHVTGQYTLVHGAFGSDEVIARSLTVAKCKICNGKGKVGRKACTCMD